MISRIRVLFLLSILFGTLMSRTAQPAPANTWETLVLTPQNTAILDGSTYAGRQLQHYLIKFYVGAEAAEPFTLDGKGNRESSEYFPLFRKASEIPAGKNVIAVGATSYLSDEDKTRLQAATNGATLLKRQGNVIIVAGSPADNPWLGDYMAMSDFLNRVCGIRFYAPDDLWVSRPQSTSIPINELNSFREQAFVTTHLAPVYERNQEWTRMNRTAGRLAINTNHNLANIFPPDKYGQTHPEIYELRGGERRIPTSVGTKIWNPSLVASALPDLTMEYIREQMQKDPGRKYISLGMMDIEFHDETPAAQESVTQYGDYSNLYYEYVNEVARRTAKEFPGLILTTFVYSNARQAPVGMKIEPNVAVKLVTKLYRHVEPEFAAWERQRVLDFAALGGKWFIHDWAFSGVSPRLYTNQYASFLQWGKQNGMLGAYVEYSPGEHWYLEGAKYWVLTQLLADPYQDADLLWKQYCDDMYGAASEEMFKLFQHYHDKFAYAPEYIRLDDLPRQEPALYTPEDLAYERELLERASAKTRDEPRIQERLAKVLRQFIGHELFALATHRPNTLDVNWQGNGINKELLAFYVNDDGSKLDEAIAYYDTKRTLAPDARQIADRLGLRTSYINNFTRGFAGLLRAIRSEATRDVDLSNMDAAKLSLLNSNAERVLHANLPQKYLPQQVRKFESILEKSLLIPRAAQMPKIDGDLSDAAWNGAAPLSDWTERDTLLMPRHTTEGKIMRVGDKLVIGLKARQNGPIWAQSSKETVAGTHIWRESGFEIFFGPLPKEGEDKAPFAQYIVNAKGSFRGFQAARDNRKGVEAETKLNPDENTYVVEIALPLKSDDYDYTEQKALTFNIARNVFTRDSYEADVILGWYPIFYTVYNLESRGVVFFDGK